MYWCRSLVLLAFVLGETTGIAASTKSKQTEAEALPEAKPGECYVRVRQPAVYETVKETVVFSPETVRYDIVPAKFRTVEKKVLIRPESKRYEVIPAKFERKTVEVDSEPAHKVLTAAEPKLVDKKKTIVVKPERVIWKQGDGLIGKVGAVVGDIWCLVREPADVHTFETKELATAAKVTVRPIAVKKAKVETMVMTAPAKVKEIVEPAQYKTIKVRELVSPATQKKVVVPAKSKVIDRQVLKTPEQIVWQRVLCGTNVTKDLIMQVEKKLKRAGFQRAEPDGEFGPTTQDAVRKYQIKHKLATGGLTYEFLDHIGVHP